MLGLHFNPFPANTAASFVTIDFGKRGKHPLWKLYSPFEYANLLQGTLKNGAETSSERLDQTDRPTGYI